MTLNFVIHILRGLGFLTLENLGVSMKIDQARHGRTVLILRSWDSRGP